MRDIRPSMPRKRKPNPKWVNPKESKRFLDTAKAVEASDDPEDFERAFKKVVPHRGKAKPSR